VSASQTERFILYTKDQTIERVVVDTRQPYTESRGHELFREIEKNSDRHADNRNGHVWRAGEQVVIELINNSIPRTAVETTEHEPAEEALWLARDELETLVRDRTRDLARANEELRLAGEKQHRMLEGVIQAVSLMLEKRDPYTAGHERHVAQLASGIATEMGLPSDQIEGVQLAARIHDIGKISVPAEILCKPGRLSEEEFALIKAHPKTGYDILEPIDFPWPIAEMVHQHHEMLDGSGYPRGLYGDQILLEARILCIADRVEAMASHRPYKPSLGIHAALDEISRNARHLYDAEATDACLKLFHRNSFAFR
jgi:HD-GYP domain-containing protein (c-di-GMP phosphodiesterase class II)